jgi:nitroreductase
VAGALTGYGFELVGIGTAAENIWIAATALGLGAAFMGNVVIAEPLIGGRLKFDGDLVGVFVLGQTNQMCSKAVPADRPYGDRRVVWHHD